MKKRKNLKKTLSEKTVPFIYIESISSIKFAFKFLKLQLKAFIYVSFFAKFPVKGSFINDVAHRGTSGFYAQACTQREDSGIRKGPKLRYVI